MPNRPQKPPKGQLPAEAAYQKTHAAAEPDIPPAHPKAQLQPCPEEDDHKHQIRQVGQLAPQRAQKTVKDAKAHSQQAGDAEMADRFCRDHPISRRSQPPAGRGSW